MHGLLNLNKPTGVTSRDVVNQVQRLVRPAKVGHAGTLDPLATGVLVVSIGNATRLIEYVQRLPKSYRATFEFGRSSDTDDIEGKVVHVPDAPRPSIESLTSTLPRFIGEISQRPPAFSAIKLQGQRAYDLARRGETVELPERPVTIHSIRIVEFSYPNLLLDICCGSGTYVRAIGRDLANAVGSCAVMSALVRTAIGSFRVEEALDPMSLTSQTLNAALLPTELAVQSLESVQLTESEVSRCRRGQFLSRPTHGFTDAIAGLDGSGKLAAILIPADEDQLRPDKVMN